MSTSVNNNTQQFVTVFVPVQIPVSLANQFNLTENQVVPASAINTFFESDDNLCFESQVDTVMQCETCDTNTTATATTSGATDMVVTTECFVRNPMESSTTSFEMQSSSHHSCTMVEQEEEEIPEQEVFQEHNTTETTTTGETFNSFKSSVFGNSRTIESVRLCSPSLDARGGAAGDAASAARACANTNNNNNNVVNRFVVENNQQFEEHHSSSGSHSSSSSSSCLRSDQDCFDRDRVIDRSIIIGCSTIPNPCVPCLNSPAATISTAAVNNSVLHDWSVLPLPLCCKSYLLGDICYYYCSSNIDFQLQQQQQQQQEQQQQSLKKQFKKNQFKQDNKWNNIGKRTNWHNDNSNFNSNNQFNFNTLLMV